MSEIEKMYRNSGIEKCNRFLKPCPFGNECDGCEHYWYPEFTAEKQIKLIEFFIFSIWWENLKSLYRIIDDSLKFEEKLAKMVNYLWLSLTEEEKKQIKDILDEAEKI